MNNSISLFGLVNEVKLINIISKAGFLLRKTKTGSIQVILQKNFRPNTRWWSEIQNTKKNYKYLTLGRSGIDGKFTVRVSGPAYWKFAQKWETPIADRHWGYDMDDLTGILKKWL